MALLKHMFNVGMSIDDDSTQVEVNFARKEI